MATDIAMYVRKGKKFNRKDWDSLREILGILPLGINAVELTILRYLAQNAEGTSLTCLSAKTGLSRACLQSDYEMFLQRLGLMEIETAGRKITGKGLDYLKQLDGKVPCGATA
jgi:Holliday junction resolvasome RuvABC ATP-dependent DNA helicase subunit